MAVSRLVVPNNIVVGEAKDDFYNKIVIVNEIRLSKRAKNGLFTIPNEKAFKNKLTDGKYTRAKNEFKSGFKVDSAYRNRSQGGKTYIFYLEHPDFNGKIPMKFDVFQDFMEGTTIINGMVQEELISTSKGFLTQKMIDAILEQEKELDKEIAGRAESIEEKRAYKKDLIPGRIYVSHDINTGIKQHMIHYGILKTSKGEYVIMQNITEKARISINFFEDHFNKNLQTYQTPNYSRAGQPAPTIVAPFRRNLPKFRVASLNSWYVRFSKGAPKLWELPKTSHNYGKNIYDFIPSKDIENIEFFLSHPLDFAAKNHMQESDFHGIIGFEQIKKDILWREENEKPANGG